MELTKPCAFSKRWLWYFKLRHGIRRLDMSGEKASAYHEAAESYFESFQKLVSEHELSADQIYNADETGLFWCCLPTSTLAGENESSASGFKQNKHHLTVLICANASGNYYRTKLLVIGKYVKPGALKGVIHLHVECRAQYNAWVDCGIFSSWFHHTFVPEEKKNLRKFNKPEDSKVILFVDNCRTHSSEMDLVSGNIFTVFLPPNISSLIQQMDQGVINLRF
uniref:DDE-1 domain-containing protein n=1 Tax=Pelodiscus sinensis TaxID=13735 RepID=K7EYA5_PELSI